MTSHSMANMMELFFDRFCLMLGTQAGGREQVKAEL